MRFDQQLIQFDLIKKIDLFRFRLKVDQVEFFIKNQSILFSMDKETNFQFGSNFGMSLIFS